MNKQDFIEVSKHVAILNVAYHLSLEIAETQGLEAKAICPFCGYNKNSKIATLSLNVTTNKYCCSRCKAQGFSTQLYSRLRGLDIKAAYKELLGKECYSMDRSHIEISPINEIADIETRDKVYRAFLNMLKLESKHKKYLEKQGFLNSTIQEQLYRSIPKKYIKRRLIANALKKQYNLEGIPGFYQEEDWGWTYTNVKGFFIPIFDENNMIQALLMHLDEPFDDTSDILFSSNGRINGTSTKSWISTNNLLPDSETVIITNDLLLNNLMRDIITVPIIGFPSLKNSYQILKVLDNTNIQNIIFAVKSSDNSNLDYIINRCFKDLIPLGYNLEKKYVENYNDLLNDNFLDFYKLKKIV